jgi:hypothetical protein
MLIKEEIKNKYASFVSYLFYYFRPDIIKDNLWACRLMLTNDSQAKIITLIICYING